MNKKEIKKKLVHACNEADMDIFGGENVEIEIEDMVDYLFQIQELGASILDIDYCDVKVKLPYLSEKLASGEDFYESFTIMKFILTNETIPIPADNKCEDNVLTLSWINNS